MLSFLILMVALKPWSFLLNHLNNHQKIVLTTDRGYQPARLLGAASIRKLHIICQMLSQKGSFINVYFYLEKYLLLGTNVTGVLIYLC